MSVFLRSMNSVEGKNDLYKFLHSMSSRFLAPAYQVIHAFDVSVVAM